jgi:dihydroneopterin aldolase
MSKFYPSQPGNPLAIRLAHILLEGIEVDIEIGVTPQEHGRVQRLSIDVEVGFDDKQTRIPDSKEALQSGGIDYSYIRDCVHLATRTKTYLIETIANRIADSVLKLPDVLTCTVKVCKNRCWADVERTSVRIFRERNAEELLGR